jgi:hypothetical protein
MNDHIMMPGANNSILMPEPTPAALWVIMLLKTLVYECQQHNADYHHITEPAVLNEALQLIDKLEKNMP